MYSRIRLFLSLLSLFVLLGCSDRGASGGRVLEARGQGPLPELATRRLWHGPEVDVQGSISPDGKLMTFSDWREGQEGSLSVRDMSTGDIRTLAKWDNKLSFAFADASLISPDGARVAYVWEEPKNVTLRVIPIAGGQPSVLYGPNPQTRYVHALAWSPDGGQILVQIAMMDRTKRLALIAYPSGAVRILKSFDWRPLETATFSPDGRYIVYSLAADTKSAQHDLHLLSTDGSREVTIASSPADEQVLGWPRGGNAVWFFADQNGAPAVWSLDIVDGNVRGTPRLVKRDLWRMVGSLGFDQTGSLHYAISPTSRQVYTATLDASGAQLLVAPAAVAEGTDMQTGADWSSDGRMLAYASRRTGARHVIVIRTMQSGEVRELTPPMRYVQSVTWSPDGQSIFARGQDEEGRYGAYRIDARTGAMLSTHRRANLGGFTTLTVAPDGSALYYSGGTLGDATGESAIIRRDLKTDQELVLHKFRGNGGGPSVSPDGRFLAFSLPSGGPEEPASLWTMHVDGTEAKAIYRMPKGTQSSPYRGPIVWTKDGHLLFVTTGGPGTSLWRIPVAGGEATKIAVDLSSIRAFRLHPDGKRLAFDAGEPSYEVWVLQQPSPTSAAR
jgi:Tol biopolymer transport system component